MDLAIGREFQFYNFATFQNSHGKGQIRSNKGGSTQGQGDQMDEEEEDEESSSSSLAISPTALYSDRIGTQRSLEAEETLKSFRQQWKKELGAEGEEFQKDSATYTSFEVGSADKDSFDNCQEKGVDVDIEKQARKLFLEGVELEQNGKLYDAILQYKKAVHLVPDIEIKVFNYLKDNGEATTNPNINIKTPDIVGETSPKQDVNYSPILLGDDLNCDLVSKFSLLSLQQKCLCFPENPAKDADITRLPMEVLINILKWVVSSELDLYSLESCSEVCRGFYLASRAPDLWRLICLQTWGLESIDALPHSIKNNLRNSGNDWRTHFLKNPRVHLNGCYIAKMTYMREGERGFQDHELYRAWHMVHFYRLIRFFPGGKIIMITTAEEPSQAVKAFNMQGICIPDCMIGRYRTVHNRVICVAQKAKDYNGNNSTTSNNVPKYQRSGKTVKAVPYVFEVPEQVFHFVS